MASIPGWFFDEISISNTGYLNVPSGIFDFSATNMMIRVDEGSLVEFSFNGIDRHGILKLEDQFAAWDNLHQSRIWFKAPAAAKLRVWAWLCQK